MEPLGKHWNLEVPAGIRKTPLKQMIISNLVEEDIVEDKRSQIKSLEMQLELAKVKMQATIKARENESKVS